jgi:hypothetical protein
LDSSRPTAAVGAAEVTPGTDAYELMRGIGNLCISHDRDPRVRPRAVWSTCSCEDCSNHADAALPPIVRHGHDQPGGTGLVSAMSC